MKPKEIEDLSFKIIDKEAKNHGFTPEKWQVLRRIIHTTADFEYLKTIRFHPNAISIAISTILKGKAIFTDTNMARVGIRSSVLDKFNISAQCLINAPKVCKMAEEKEMTRAKASVICAAADVEGGIYVVGNAPTALFEIIKLFKQNLISPALVIGFPVGFVNAAESKAALIETKIPYITNHGRKGGSNVAASVVNALTLLAIEKFNNIKKKAFNK